MGVVDFNASNFVIASIATLMYVDGVRTTVNIDSDAYDFASAYAGGKGITLSAAISELLRRAEHAPDHATGSGRLEMNEYGYLEIVGGERITPEMVKEASEDKLV